MTYGCWDTACHSSKHLRKAISVGYYYVYNSLHFLFTPFSLKCRLPKAETRTCPHQQHLAFQTRKPSNSAFVANQLPGVALCWGEGEPNAFSVERCSVTCWWNLVWELTLADIRMFSIQNSKWGWLPAFRPSPPLGSPRRVLRFSWNYNWSPY